MWTWQPQHLGYQAKAKFQLLLLDNYMVALVLRPKYDDLWHSGVLVRWKADKKVNFAVQQVCECRQKATSERS